MKNKNDPGTPGDYRHALREHMKRVSDAFAAALQAVADEAYHRSRGLAEDYHRNGTIESQRNREDAVLAFDRAMEDVLVQAAEPRCPHAAAHAAAEYKAKRATWAAADKARAQAAKKKAKVKP